MQVTGHSSICETTRTGGVASPASAGKGGVHATIIQPIPVRNRQIERKYEGPKMAQGRLERFRRALTVMIVPLQLRTQHLATLCLTSIDVAFPPQLHQKRANTGECVQRQPPLAGVDCSLEAHHHRSRLRPPNGARGSHSERTGSRSPPSPAETLPRPPAMN